MSQQESYCLDVFLEGDEILWEDLIDFLKVEKKKFKITKGQYGMWETLRFLRILTPQAKALADCIPEKVRGAENYSYDEYPSQKIAENSRFWDPGNNKEFDIAESCFG